MEIEFRKGCRFGRLEEGDVFQYCDDIYIKTPESICEDRYSPSTTRNATSLISGQLEYFEYSDKVEFKGEFLKREDKKENEE